MDLFEGADNVPEAARAAIAKNFERLMTRSDFKRALDVVGEKRMQPTDEIAALILARDRPRSAQQGAAAWWALSEADVPRREAGR